MLIHFNTYISDTILTIFLLIKLYPDVNIIGLMFFLIYMIIMNTI